MRRGRRIGLIVVVLFLAGAFGAALWRARGATTHVGSTAKAHGALPAAAGPEALLEKSLNVIADGERAPRDRRDPSYVAEVLGRDPIAHLDWVRSHTAWVPYRGVLRGPVGVLLDRQGNSLDRTLLLAAQLTRAMSVTAR
jgi:hypothetical protein